MKKILAILMVGISTVQFAFAAPASTPAQTETSSGSGLQNIGIGASFESERLVRSDTALTLFMPLTQKGALQVYFAIPGTEPTFTIGTAALYKHTVYGHRTLGFHLGGGVGLGGTGVSNETKFFAHILGNMGFHFAFPQFDRILFSVDAGPTLEIVDGDANFAIDVTSISAVFVF